VSIADVPEDSSARCFLREMRRRLNARKVASTAAPATGMPNSFSAGAPDGAAWPRSCGWDPTDAGGSGSLCWGGMPPRHIRPVDTTVL